MHMVLEDFAKEEYKADEAARGTPGVSPDKTLKAVWAADPELFGKYLHANHHDDLAARLATGTIDAADLSALEPFRESFIARKEQAKQVSEGLTPDLINTLIKSNDNLEKLSRHLPAADMLAMVKKHVIDIAMSDPTIFDTVQQELPLMKAFKEGAYKKLDEDVSGLCKKAGISGEAFAKAMQDLDQTARVDAIQAEIQKNYRFYMRAYDFIKKGEVSANWARTLEGKKGDIDTARGQMRDHLNAIGDALNMSLTSRPEMMKLLAKEILGDKKAATERTTKVKDVRNKVPTEDEILAEYRTAFPAGGANDVQKEALLTAIAQRTENNLNPVVSIWKTILGGFLTKLLTPGPSRDRLKAKMA